MNFAKGILESRVQTYKHLKTVLRPIPLQTPTEIDLSPIERIRVTLFDANHCPGAVMFLIEGDGKAILYTGDIRAEPWWVNQIVRSPIILPYSRGHKNLDTIYLDTTFAVKDDVYKEFPPKASGLSELLDKISKYPPETTFYFRAWTLGYEDVWITLSSFLRDQFGNQRHKGCFTLDKNAGIHSCEPGTQCHAELSQKAVVWITPIITRTNTGEDVLELGAGGGGGDLYQVPLLDIADIYAIQKLEQLLHKKVNDLTTQSAILDRIRAARDAGQLRISLEGLDKDVYEDIPISELVNLIAKDSKVSKCSSMAKAALKGLPDTVHFPYSRHSSYSELCHLVSAFRPKDIHPCTVDADTWSEEVSMGYLFGHCCSSSIFTHDEKMRELLQDKMEMAQSQRKRKRKRLESQEDSQKSSEDNSSQFSNFKTAHEASHPINQVRQPNDDQVEPHHKLDTPKTRSPNHHEPPYIPQLTTVDKPNLSEKQNSVKKFQKSSTKVDNLHWLDSSPSSVHSSSHPAKAQPPTSPPSNTTNTTPSPSPPSPTPSFLNSQSLLHLPISSNPESSSPTDSFFSARKRSRLKRRLDAYNAARRAIEDPELGAEWDDFRPRTAGNSHEKEEIEL
ncbi:putative dna repair [Phaeomoniella chlamydospora]|uniref:Protein artemis n=1 Tax=Phaeomoniella chlamydospora TaxID=158046 RepID=A0A0G2EIW4_PHACM|nr:putative dna repair [Phaeomoniella chlamydospora]